MRKMILSGSIASTCLTCLTMLAMIGCSETESKSSYVGKKQQQRPITVAVKPDRKSKDILPSDVKESEQVSSADAQCQDDLECVVIPTGDGCVPCTDGDVQLPVNITAARRIMAPRKDKCMPIIKELMKNGQENPPKRTQGEVCQYNGAKCVQGICQLANLSEEEFKQRMTPPQKTQNSRPAVEPANGYNGNNGYGNGTGTDVNGFDNMDTSPQSFDRYNNIGSTPRYDRLSDVGTSSDNYGRFGRIDSGVSNYDRLSDMGMSSDNYGRFGKQNFGSTSYGRFKDPRINPAGYSNGNNSASYGGFSSGGYPGTANDFGASSYPTSTRF